MKFVDIKIMDISEDSVSADDTFVDIQSMTLRQLRSKLNSTESSDTYEANWFEKHPEMIFCTILKGDVTLTVYKNRFYTYKKHGYTCVLHIDFQYIDYERNQLLFTDIKNISEEEFLDKPFFATLAYIGEMQWEANLEKRENYHRAFSIDGNKNDWNNLLMTPCFIQIKEELECLAEKNAELYKALMKLSSVQRKVVMLKFFGCMKQEQIAKVLNISQPVVSIHLKRALSNLKHIIESDNSNNFHIS